MSSGFNNDMSTSNPTGPASTIQEAAELSAAQSLAAEGGGPPLKHRSSNATLAKRFIGAWGLHILLIAGSFILILPFAWMILASFKPLSQINDTNWVPEPHPLLQVEEYIDDMAHGVELADLLQDDNAGPVAEYLRGRLSPGFAEHLPDLAPGENGDLSLSQKRSLATEVNRVIGGDARLDKAPAFADVDLGERGRALAQRTDDLAQQARTDTSPAMNQQLQQARSMTNRVVLHQALPEIIPPPRTLQWHNYLAVFFTIPFARYYWNSLFIACWVTFLQVFTSSLAAFSFARLQWPGRDKVFLLYLSTMMLPGLVMMIPNYQIMITLGLVDTLTGLILPAAFTAFGTFLLRQFMLSIPASLDEAAEIDGASKWRVYWDVILPLTRPGLITLAIFTFMQAYQNFFWPLVMLRSQYRYTLPIGMLYFDSTAGQQTNQLMAAVTMSVLPMIVVFILLQKKLVKGIQLGAVKG